MEYKDMDDKTQALLELNAAFNLLSLVRKDTVLIILSDDEDAGEFTVRVIDAMEEESTSTIIAQGIISMLEDNPDVIYLQGIEAPTEEYTNYEGNVIPFSVKKKIKEDEPE